MKLHMLLHGHHENGNGCPLSVGYQSLAARRAQIKDIKPRAEQPLRLALICNVRPEELPTKARKAGAVYDKALAVYDKAWAVYDKVWAVYNKAGAVYNKAGDVYDNAQDVYDIAQDVYDNAQDVYDKVWAVYNKAGAVYDKAWAVYNKAGDAFVTSLTPSQWGRWHKKVCKHPGCKWTAEHPSIF